jgi:hypothetical protein
MLALKILPRSTKSLLRHVLTGARQHQLPVVYAPDRDELQLLCDAGKTYLPPSRAAALIADIAAGVSTRLLDGCCAASTIADYLSRRWRAPKSRGSSRLAVWFLRWWLRPESQIPTAE